MIIGDDVPANSDVCSGMVTIGLDAFPPGARRGMVLERCTGPASRGYGVDEGSTHRRGSGSRSRLVRRATRSSLPCARALTKREREKEIPDARQWPTWVLQSPSGFCTREYEDKSGHVAQCTLISVSPRDIHWTDGRRRPAWGEREDCSLLSLIYVGLRTYGKNLFSTRTVYRSSTALYRNLLLPSPQKIPF